MYVVILAGGGGTRLRPMSRPELPKPFLPLLEPDPLLGQRSLFQGTLARLPEDVPDLFDRARAVFVVTDRRYEQIVLEQAAVVPGFAPGAVRVLCEPAGRNTAPAIALAAAAIDRDDDDVMVVLPADHLVRNEAVFRDVILGVATGMAPGLPGVERPLVTLGIQPAGPETVYGYIRPRRDEDGRAVSQVVGCEVPGRPGTIQLTAHPVESFEEKPTRERAEELLHEGGREGGVYWNAGMFAWTRRAIREAFALDPRAATTWEAISGAVTRGGSRALETAYQRVESISIDYAVMEPAARAGRVVTSGMDVGWSDLGSWTALLHALDPGGDVPLFGPLVRGHVVEAGEAVELGPDDLLVLAEGGRLHFVPGPRGTMVLGTTGALLSGARPGMALVKALLDRVNRVILEAPAR